jgi:hypothetical protein
MKKTLLSGIVVMAAVALLPTEAKAQVIISTRCSIDNMADNAAAEKRVAWARQCGLQRNVGSPSYGFQSTIPNASGGYLTDYQEVTRDTSGWGEGAYCGRDRGFRVNENYIWAIYLSGPTTQSVDPQGYYIWSREPWRKKGRVLYPTFGSTPNATDTGNKQLFPNANNDPNDCTFYERVWDPNVPGGWKFVPAAPGPIYMNGYCEASCYTPEQEVLFSDGYMPIVDAFEARREDVVTLAPDATLDDVKLQQNRTYSYTREIRDAMHHIYVIRTASGGELRVTNEHPVLNGEGRIVQAQTLKVGQDLLKADGTPDRITDIQKTQYFGKVYNISPVSTDLVSNVVVAQGFLVGSSRFQNDEVGYMNRMLLYRSVPAHTLP